jgi:hypothetical protein
MESAPVQGSQPAADEDVQLVDCDMIWHIWDSPFITPEIPPGKKGFNVPRGDFTIIRCTDAFVQGVHVGPFDLAFLGEYIRDQAGTPDGSADSLLLDVFANSAVFRELAAKAGLTIKPLDGVALRVSQPGNYYGEGYELQVPAQNPQYSVKGFLAPPPKNYGYRGNETFYFAAKAGFGTLFLQYVGSEYPLGNQAVMTAGPGSYWAAHSPIPASFVWVNHEAKFSGNLTFHSLAKG